MKCQLSGYDSVVVTRLLISCGKKIARGVSQLLRLWEESLIHTQVQQKRAEIKKIVLVYLPLKKKVAFLLHLRKIHGLNPGVLVEVPEAKY